MKPAATSSAGSGSGLQLHLADHGLEAEVTGREKHPYSIWKKMAERHISFEQLSDVMAFRVIVDEVDDCLSRARADPPALADGPGPLQGLISRPPSATAIARCTPSVIHDSKMRIEIQIRDAGDARPGRARARRALGL